MKTVILDSRTPEKCIDKLIYLGFETILLPCFPSLPDPVSAHPDMLLFFAGRKVICHKDYFKVAEKELAQIMSKGYELLLSDEAIGAKYPSDILFNALPIGSSIYCKADSISHHILDHVKKNSMSVHNVKQGYTKCSVCPVGDNAAITADIPLAKAMQKNGIDVLLISSGNITLRGYDMGFIGGSAGEVGNTVYFLGNIMLHPNGAEIVDFCQKHDRSAVSLSEEKLFDGGSLIFI